MEKLNNTTTAFLVVQAFNLTREQMKATWPREAGKQFRDLCKVTVTSVCPPNSLASALLDFFHHAGEEYLSGKQAFCILEKGNNLVEMSASTSVANFQFSTAGAKYCL